MTSTTTADRLGDVLNELKLLKRDLADSHSTAADALRQAVGYVEDALDAVTGEDD